MVDDTAGVRSNFIQNYKEDIEFLKRPRQISNYYTLRQTPTTSQLKEQ